MHIYVTRTLYNDNHQVKINQRVMRWINIQEQEFNAREIRYHNQAVNTYNDVISQLIPMINRSSGSQKVQLIAVMIRQISLKLESKRELERLTRQL